VFNHLAELVVLDCVQVGDVAEQAAASSTTPAAYLTTIVIPWKPVRTL
jgi:hypothetical protein